jgi:hypothetical protein
MSTGQYTGPVVVPMPTARPGSATLADVYPGLGPSTAAAGGEGATRERAALAAGGSPLSIDVGADFLARPAGWLVLGIAALAALSYFDR